MPKKMRRVLIISDLHCGHFAGLTPPSWHHSPSSTSDPLQQRFLEFCKFSYGKFYKIVKSLQPIDVLMVNGDCVDGLGRRSGGTELWTTDVDRQCDMATEIIKFIKAKKIIIISDACHSGGVGQPFDIAKRAGKESMINQITNPDIIYIAFYNRLLYI